MMIDILARIATTTDGIRIGFFTASGKEYYANVYQDTAERIVFANKSFINLAFGVKKLEDCFKFAGLEFDLVWIDESSDMTADAIEFIKTTRRSINRPTGIILT